MKLESGKWYESSEHKLEADEIMGRIVLDMYKGFQITITPHLAEENPVSIITALYGCKDMTNIRYMLIDPPQEQPLEYKGMKPNIENGLFNWIVSWGYINDSRERHQFFATTKSEAISAWNSFVRGDK